METAKKPLQIIDTSTEVSLQEKIYLVQGAKKYPIHAEQASKYSLFFRYSEDHPLTDSNQPVSLLIQNNGNRVELGPCRILSGPNLNGYAGRLVFTRDVYDIESLFSENKIQKLLALNSDLQRVLARKKKVRPAFKAYIANLSYDLSVYKKRFDDLDFEYREEPAEVRAAIQNAIIESEGPEFRRFFEDKLDELKLLVDNFSPEEHQLHGFYFRRQLWNYILSCPFTARATLKPRGYAGDSGLMRMVYLNDYQGDSTFSKISHKHAVEHAAAQSVRYRITLIAKMLHGSNNLTAMSSTDRFKVLSIGCGPAFELKQILQSWRDCAKFKFTLFDQDAAALSEAADVAAQIQKKLGASPAIEYVQGSVRLMLFSRRLKQKWGRFHFIYSLGLFDYLNPRVAAAVLDRMYRLLKPGGELVVGNFHVTNPSKYYMQYWGDWPILHRTEEEFKRLFHNNSSSKISVLYEETGSQMFLHIKKPDKSN